MDLATLVGIIMGVGFITAAMIPPLGPGLIAYFDLPSIMIVLGGTSAAVLMNYPLKDIMKVMTVVKNAFLHKEQAPQEIITIIVGFATKARRDGILALEKEASRIDDDFLKKGIRLAVDGTDADTISKILNTELENMTARHKGGSGVLAAAATYAPAFGMIGTLIGLIAMLLNMNDPSTIGPAMSVALVTTFYGALIANLVCTPLAGKLDKRSSNELLIREIMIEGILAIQLGDNPRMVEEKLMAYLPPIDRTSRD